MNTRTAARPIRTLIRPRRTYWAPREAPTVARSSKRGSRSREPELITWTRSLTSDCLKPKGPPVMIPPLESGELRTGSVTISLSMTMAICSDSCSVVNASKSF